MNNQLTYNCPLCSNDLLWTNISSKHLGMKEGILECEHCNVYTPVINGIVYFTESDVDIYKQPLDFYNGIKEKIIKRRTHYFQFLKQKQQRKVLDSYSAFQPFNESSRAFYPFIHLLKKRLKPNDIILDTWCRTGWSAFFLAGLFKEQRIISIWEGNKDTLGYEGFDYWLSYEKKPDNVDILFHDLNKPLPISNDSIAFVHGLDTLHRYNLHVLTHELLRVVKDDGIIIFPHVHLTNAEPDPFFERGERQLHGKDYDRFFKRVLKSHNKEIFITSEPQMFEIDAPVQIQNTPDTKDYNALIALLPKELSSEKIEPFNHKIFDNSELRIITNPLLIVDLLQQTVALDKNHLDGMVGHLLDRHPIYHERVQKSDKFKLSQAQIEILYWSECGYNIREICNQLAIDPSCLFSEVEPLVTADIIHILPISEQAFYLQQFHSKQQVNYPKSTQNMHHLLSLGADEFANNPVLINSTDDSIASYEHVCQIIELIHKKIIAGHFQKGDSVCISSQVDFESILVYWAFCSFGAQVFILNSDMPGETMSSILEDHKPKIIFTDAEVFEKLSMDNQSMAIVFDHPEISHEDHRLFSHWLNEDLSINSDTPQFLLPKITSDDVSTILYTSGSTGNPKGVLLSHGALFRSAKLLAEIYQWTSSDKILCTSQLDSMSGLRNICIAPLFSGTTIVIPQLEKGKNIFDIVMEIAKHQITILSATPALIKQLLSLGERIKNELQSLRQVICTGGKLTHSMVTQFSDLFDIRILNYYGLTETTGLCIAEPTRGVDDKKESIGVAVHSIIQVVDEYGEKVNQGDVGQLRVFNDRLMLGYHNQEKHKGVHIEKGWLYTGDLAYQDRDGYFFLTGRMRDMIKNEYGAVTYFSEVEQCLLKHENIIEAAVCGYTQDDIEYLAAFIVQSEKTTSIKSIKKYLKDTIGEGKVPRVIVAVDNLKMTKRGKVDKKGLMKNIKLDEY